GVRIQPAERLEVALRRPDRGERVGVREARALEREPVLLAALARSVIGEEVEAEGDGPLGSSPAPRVGGFSLIGRKPRAGVRARTAAGALVRGAALRRDPREPALAHTDLEQAALLGRQLRQSVAIVAVAHAADSLSSPSEAATARDDGAVSSAAPLSCS